LDTVHASGGSPPLAQDADFLLIVISPAIPIAITSEISPHCPKVGIADTKQDPEVIKVPNAKGESPTFTVWITILSLVLITLTVLLSESATYSNNPSEVMSIPHLALNPQVLCQPRFCLMF